MAVRCISEYERRFLTEGALSLAYSMFAEKIFPDHVVEAVMTEAINYGHGGYTVDEELLYAILWAICERHVKSPETQETWDHNRNDFRLS